MAFGVLDWDNDGEVDEFDDRDSVSSEVEPKRSHHQSLSRSLTPSPIDASMFKQEDRHSRRIQRVRNRCKTQNQALSTWWKVAIQSNIQQRMWMQLGRSSAETLVQPRFERLYQPEKIAQFDRFFARSWATPVRRSHTAQHSGESDEGKDVAEFRRIISGRLSRPSQKPNSRAPKKKDEWSSSLEQFVADYGFEPQSEPLLKMFVEHHDAVDSQTKPSKSSFSGKYFSVLTFSIAILIICSEPSNVDENIPLFIGDTNQGKEYPRSEYLDYVRPQNELPASPFRGKAFAEFKDSLQGMSLNADNVAGIREVCRVR